MLKLIERLLLSAAPWLLVLSVVLRAPSLVTGFGSESIDLYVYWSLAPHVLEGDLYQVTSARSPSDFPLPFTYPPFGALMFLPMTWMAWSGARWVFLLISMACLYWIVRVALRLIAGNAWAADKWAWRRRAILWTSALLWMRPVFHTFEFGQVNLVLAAVVLASMVASNSRTAGVGVGLAAGVKLVPAISGLYFLAAGQRRAVVRAVSCFATSVGLGFLVDFDQAKRYWFELLFDASRVGPVATAHNQSLRGALARTLGYDVGMSWPWIVSVVAAVALGFLALRAAVRARDVLIGVLIVQLIGLLASPISWDHHWVWVAPLLIWVVYSEIGLVARTALLLVWCPIMFWDVIAFQLDRQPTIWTISRPGWLSLIGWAYPAAALVTLVMTSLILKSGGGRRGLGQWAERAVARVE